MIVPYRSRGHRRTARYRPTHSQTTGRRPSRKSAGQDAVAAGPGSQFDAASRARRSLRRILPDADFGIWSMNSTTRTFLCGAMRSAT
jgi:hypothetical protein